MMSEFRRRLLMQNALKGSSGDLGYIKDGMILHLDGINKGCDSTAWTDLIKGVKFKYSNCELKDNAVFFNGQNSFAYCDDAVISADHKTSTIEVCFKGLGYRYRDKQNIFISYKEQDVAFGYNAVGECPLSYYMGTPSYRLEGYRINTVSLNYDRGIAKLKVMKKESNFWLPNGKNLYSIGARILSNGTPDWLYYGSIHSIRIYNRRLSEEEMLQNQKVDINRFFGGEIPQ